MLVLREERAALVVLPYFTVHESQQYSGKETLALIGCYMYHVLLLVGTLQGLGCATSFGIRSADGQTQCFPLRLAVGSPAIGGPRLGIQMASFFVAEMLVRISPSARFCASYILRVHSRRMTRGAKFGPRRVYRGRYILMQVAREMEQTSTF